MLLRLDNERDSKDACRRIGRIVEDPNLRGWAYVVADPALGKSHFVAHALERVRVALLRGPDGIAIVGDTYALYLAARELQTLLPGFGPSIEAIEGTPAPLELGARTFDWSRPVVMGVVNVTPDSFSDGGQFLDPANAIAHGFRLAAEGADVLDVGGESTRPRGATYGPGAQLVSDDDEIARVVPVIRGLREKTDVPISIDTRKSRVARAAVEAGATLINDVTGLLHDEAIADVAKETGAALCLMHTPADIEALAHETPSEDVVGEVLAGLGRSIEKALAHGLSRDWLLVDPGLGFGKTPGGNFLLVRQLGALVSLGLPVLVGASRKASFAKIASDDPANTLPMEQRLPASLAAAVMAVERGAHLVRVHDVAETVRALRVWQAIRAS